MSWKIFLTFFAGLSAIPVGVVALLTIDDVISERAYKKWLRENDDDSCPLPACGGRNPRCRGDDPCDVLLAVRGGVYEQVYEDK